MAWGNESLITIVPQRFMPWMTGRQAGSPLFFNKVNVDGAGHEDVYEIFKQTDVPYSGLALFTGDTGELIFDECDLEYFLAFFNARRGKLHTFQFRYWADYKCTAEPYINCFDEGIYTQGVTYPAKGNGSNQDFKLLKLYSDDTNNLSYRRIYIPIESTIEVFADGVAVGFSYIGNGVIEISPAPALNAVITHNCEFDIRCRFDQDNFAIEVISNQPGTERYKLSPIPIVEVVSP
jgi:uncharacterized protein (TIGR02217 family)